ncbi:O-fucosyltransferase family protein [Striga asiatica]|uniref:O-fucosyltransferase family protein n=1 Tax=Striga asiatica TaxID=4170 RepID=A0A5A7QI29_STRAF|nr:O-fucosyltransferase family protein [Striga asiatica]
MPYSNSSEITTAGASTRGEDEEADRVPGLEFRIPSDNSISSMRLSVSSPRLSFASSTALSSPASSGYLTGASFDPRKMRKSKRSSSWHRRRLAVGLAVLLGFLFAMNWWMLSRIQEPGRRRGGFKVKILRANKSTVFIKFHTMSNALFHWPKRLLMRIVGSLKVEELQKLGRGKKPQKTIYARLLAKAAHALADGESKPEPKELWLEPYARASSWTPCANKRSWQPSEGKTGYIMVTANGGINQQRVAVCNAVAVARLLNATLVLPKFMYSSVWRDASQFGDIYQEDHFINYLKPDIPIVKDLPKELQSLDLEAIGSLVMDTDIMKEAKPSFYLKYILPLLHLNRVVHFVGFGNRLASDPIPHPLQRLRCRCNFHALRFTPKIQEAGAMLIRRMRQNEKGLGRLDPYLVGPFAHSTMKRQKGRAAKTSKYLALHLRFEIDMVAHSLCEFGGGEEEMKELEAYRQIHFPALVELKKTKKFPSPTELRSEGLCPLMPEETVLMLAALGFNRRAHIYLAGAHIYGGSSRLAALTTLFPNMVTKENLLSADEMQPFANYSSQSAALDFIVCSAADVFAMTDSGSQFSSLVAGYRIYYGGGKMPTIRPNKRRLADIFVKNNTIEWKVFETRVRKAIAGYKVEGYACNIRGFHAGFRYQSKTANHVDPQVDDS